MRALVPAGPRCEHTGLADALRILQMARDLTGGVLLIGAQRIPHCKQYVVAGSGRVHLCEAGLPPDLQPALRHMGEVGMDAAHIRHLMAPVNLLIFFDHRRIPLCTVWVVRSSREKAASSVSASARRPGPKSMAP